MQWPGGHRPNYLVDDYSFYVRIGTEPKQMWKNNHSCAGFIITRKDVSIDCNFFKIKTINQNDFFSDTHGLLQR